MNQKKLSHVTCAAVIAAAYVILGVLFAPFGTKVIQVRFSEALSILPLFTSAAVPGLFIGCLLGNLLSGCILPDVIFGSLATLIGAIGTRYFRKSHPFLGTLPPILANTITVPLVFRYGYGVQLPLPYMMLTVGIGEILSCGLLGILLYEILKPLRSKLFPDK